MKKLRFKLKLITPMFLGGAEPFTAETRPASLKGVMRYWYRILMANKHAPSYGIDSSKDWMNYKNWSNEKLWQKVYEDESELFGTQNRAGKVWIRMEKIKRDLLKNNKEEEAGKGRIRMEKRSEDLSESEVKVEKWLEKWLDDYGEKLYYIGYGPVLFVNPKNDRYKDLRKLYRNRKGFGPVRGYFSPDDKFAEKLVKEWDVEFILRDDRYEDRLIGLLWFVSMFGSLGSRSRKGWGSFHLEPDDEKNEKKYDFGGWEYKDQKQFEEDFDRAVRKLGIDNVYNLEVYMISRIRDIFAFNKVYKEFMHSKPLKVRNYFGLPRGRYSMRRASPVHFKLTRKGLLIIRKLEPFYENNRVVDMGAFKQFLNSLNSRIKLI